MTRHAGLSARPKYKARTGDTDGGKKALHHSVKGYAEMGKRIAAKPITLASRAR